MLLANMYHARAFLFQPEKWQQTVPASNQTFHAIAFSREIFSLTNNWNPESLSYFQWGKP